MGVAQKLNILKEKSGSNTIDPQLQTANNIEEVIPKGSISDNKSVKSDVIYSIDEELKESHHFSDDSLSSEDQSEEF